MHPNVFLKSFWRLNLRPQVFVAMSFASQYDARFNDIIAPAIRSVAVGGTPLEPHRVDLSKSGDSILTEIMDGIAHSRLVLADISSMGHDEVTGHAYRNGNVMYEVGLALACRQTTDVLLVRDDKDNFLFDVSTIPHMHINFTDADNAVSALSQALMERINEQAFVNDSRVQLAVASLSGEESDMLRLEADKPFGEVWSKPNKLYNFSVMARLLDKQLIKLVGRDRERDRGAYQFTELGYAAAQAVKHGLPEFGPPATGS